MIAFLLTCLGVIVAAGLIACWIESRCPIERTRTGRILDLVFAGVAPWKLPPGPERDRLTKAYHDYVEGR